MPIETDEEADAVNLGDIDAYVDDLDGDDDVNVDIESESELRRGNAKRMRAHFADSDVQTKRRRKQRQRTTANEDEDDIVERFEFEIEESVANWFDEFKISRNEIPDSFGDDEDPIIVRDRKIRMGTNDRLAIGRTFFNEFDVKEVVLHHALNTQENIKQSRWGTHKISFRCAQDPKCDWRVYCSFEKDRQLWVLKTKCGYHSCTPNGKCKLLKSPVIAKLFMDKLRMKPDYMPLDIQLYIKEKWKLLSSIGQVQRGRLLALKWLEQEYAQHFAHLRGYVAELKTSNAGSTAIVETVSNAAGEDVFNRFYLCLGAMKKGFYYCRPIIGIDGTFLKQAVKGCLLTAVAHDGNNQIYPIAWAAVQTENADNWVWFLKQLKAHLDLKDGANYVIISDRSKGIISSVKSELPNAEHRMCVKHIVENLKGRHPNKDLLKPMVWALAWSYNHKDFQANLNNIRAYNMSLYEDVMKEEPKSWSRAYYKIGSCCEDVDNNSTESFNASIVQARAKALVPMLETIRRQAMQRISKRKLVVEKWKKKNTEYASDILESEKDDAMRCSVTKGTHGQFEIFLDGNSHGVNLSQDKWECSCCKWQVTGIPCEHAYGAILDVGKDVDDFVHPYFRHQFWSEVYDKAPDPVRGPSYWMTNNYVLVTKPPDPNLPGRRKGQKNYPRIKGKNESPKKKKGKNSKQETEILKLGRKGRTMHCSKCGEAGHNSVGCPKFPKEKKNKKSKSKKSKEIDEGGQSQAQETFTLSQGPEALTLSLPHGPDALTLSLPHGPEAFTHVTSSLEWFADE